jgi:hypothetical protein
MRYCFTPTAWIFAKEAMATRVSTRLLCFIPILAILLSACSSSSNNKLIGKWKHTEPVTEVTVTLEFTKDKLRFTAVGLESGPATSYKYVDESMIMVRNPDTGADVKTPYTIDGDTLTITFSGEEIAVFTRVK